MALGDRIVVMRKGAIAQVGTPRDIYFAPSNRFVAEFVGAANIVEGVCNAGTLTLPGGKLAVFDGPKTGRVCAMIRPESIKIVAPDEAGLLGLVDSVSFVGDRQRASVSGATSRTIMADVPNTMPVKAGDRVGLQIDPAAIRLLPDAAS
jgi:putative spermidine/putrescine transport system ATP-binding protein